MKKIYMKPAIASKEMELVQFVCQSAKFNSTPVSADDADAKESSIWDFMEEE